MHTVITPRRGLARLDLGEVWESRELLGFLAWRDIAVRYKQTVVGAGWAFIRPLLTMVIFTVIFGKVAKLPSDNVPYAILTFTALLPWQFFATAFGDAANSIVGNGHMVTKIYFPRLILPTASVGVGVIDFFVSLAMLVVLMIVYRVAPSPHVVALPLFLLLCIVFTIGLGLLFGAMYVKYRDIRQIIPFITQFGLYVSPVSFSSTLVPARWRLLYSLNPMVAVIDGFRWSILGTTKLYVPGVVAGCIVSAVTLFAGLVFFKQTERNFADLM
jgi:lipopolysaccharide transport system permease protein